nr:helix-turn-helix transcriptional regulator [Paenarthrobacter nitroguajacolicus]
MAEKGPMHGYQLRLIAERGHMQNWTDITPGAIYGALKRLLRDGLVREVRNEREGGRPERQIVELTVEGREELDALVTEAATAFRLPPDPFDLILARPTAEMQSNFESVLRQRSELVSAEAAIYEARIRDLGPALTDFERLAMSHKLIKIQAELSFLVQTLDALPQILKRAQSPINDRTTSVIDQ